jgi:hypothetical protein
MRKFAPCGGAYASISKVGTFLDMLLLAVKTLLAVSQHGKVATDTMFDAHMDVRVDTVVAVLASAGVGKVNAEWNALRSRIVRECTGFSAGAVAC